MLSRGTYIDVYKSLGLDNQLPRTEYEYGSGADILWILALAKNDGNSSRSPSLFEKLNHRPSETDDAELCSFYSQLLETERAISAECCKLLHLGSFCYNSSSQLGLKLGYKDQS